MKIAVPVILCFCLFATSSTFDTISWKILETGLEYASVTSPQLSSVGDSKVDILRIDPSYFSFKLVCAGEQKIKSKTMPAWCKDNSLLAGINAGMFKLEGDFQTCTGYMKNGNYINNPVINPSYKTVFAFNPIDTALPSAQIIDMTCEDWPVLKTKYRSFSQGIRMLNCEGLPTWQVQEKKWSMVLIGEDVKGHILFIFVRSPYRVNDFIKILMAVPLQLKRLMYLEGGPEASYLINHPDLNVSKMGSYETGFNENDGNVVFWDIPNVIGIKRK